MASKNSSRIAIDDSCERQEASLVMHSYRMLHATGGWQERNQLALFSVCFLQSWLVAAVSAAGTCESADQQLARAASLFGSHVFQKFCFSDLVSFILGEQ